MAVLTAATDSIGPRRVGSRRRPPKFLTQLPSLALLLVPAPHAFSTRAPTVAEAEPVRIGWLRGSGVALSQAMSPPGLVTSPADARSMNAAVAFLAPSGRAAQPFAFRGDHEDRERATDCLAAAAWYEAGDDPVGEAAVIQVVLNRVRHPVFPRSVCGVVFQGAERRTGCQFTFSCDGAMNRRPPVREWWRARAVAGAALDGRTDPTVGHATHYHTDWVHPEWSTSLDKIARVDTHLFFRWPGRFGAPAAFARSHAGSEPVIAKMAGLSTAHTPLPPPVHAAMASAHSPMPPLSHRSLLPPSPVGPERLTSMASPPAANIFLVLLDPVNPAGFPALARRACATKDYCKFIGWTNPDRVPRTLPMPGAAVDAISFSFVRSPSTGRTITRWNCVEFPQSDGTQCTLRSALRDLSYPLQRRRLDGHSALALIPATGLVRTKGDVDDQHRPRGAHDVDASKGHPRNRLPMSPGV